jgi:hypothetical protein
MSFAEIGTSDRIHCLVPFFKLAHMGSDVIAKINTKNKKLKAFERFFNVFQRFYYKWSHYTEDSTLTETTTVQ